MVLVHTQHVGPGPTLGCHRACVCSNRARDVGSVNFEGGSFSRCQTNLSFKLQLTGLGQVMSPQHIPVWPKLVSVYGSKGLGHR